MRATGILRRIDDLGRVVIPKEIRRVMKIKEGDPLEIYLEDGMVCFKRYNPIKDFDEQLSEIENDLSEHYYLKGVGDNLDAIKKAFKEIKIQLKAIETIDEERRNS